MSTQVTLEITLKDQKDVVFLIVRKSDVEVTGLSKRLFEVVRAELVRRHSRKFDDEQVRKTFKYIEVMSLNPARQSERGIMEESFFYLYFRPNDRPGESLICSDRIASIRTKVSF